MSGGLDRVGNISIPNPYNQNNTTQSVNFDILKYANINKNDADKLNSFFNTDGTLKTGKLEEFKSFLKGKGWTEAAVETMFAKKDNGEYYFFDRAGFSADKMTLQDFETFVSEQIKRYADYAGSGSQPWYKFESYNIVPKLRDEQITQLQRIPELQGLKINRQNADYILVEKIREAGQLNTYFDISRTQYYKVFNAGTGNKWTDFLNNMWPGVQVATEGKLDETQSGFSSVNYEPEKEEEQKIQPASDKIDNAQKAEKLQENINEILMGIYSGTRQKDEVTEKEYKKAVDEYLVLYAEDIPKEGTPAKTQDQRVQEIAKEYGVDLNAGAKQCIITLFDIPKEGTPAKTQEQIVKEIVKTEELDEEKKQNIIAMLNIPKEGILAKTQEEIIEEIVQEYKLDLNVGAKQCIITLFEVPEKGYPAISKAEIIAAEQKRRKDAYEKINKAKKEDPVAQQDRERISAAYETYTSAFNKLYTQKGDSKDFTLKNETALTVANINALEKAASDLRQIGSGEYAAELNHMLTNVLPSLKFTQAMKNGNLLQIPASTKEYYVIYDNKELIRFNTDTKNYSIAGSFKNNQCIIDNKAYNVRKDKILSEMDGKNCYELVAQKPGQGKGNNNNKPKPQPKVKTTAQNPKKDPTKGTTETGNTNIAKAKEKDKNRPSGF